jgi:hypothetical protein
MEKLAGNPIDQPPLVIELSSNVFHATGAAVVFEPKLDPVIVIDDP